MLRKLSKMLFMLHKGEKYAWRSEIWSKRCRILCVKMPE